MPRCAILIGSKEGLAHLPLGCVNPGELVLVPSRAYPVYHSATLFAGGRPMDMPLSADTDWLPDLEAIPALKKLGVDESNLKEILAEAQNNEKAFWK